MSHTGTVLLCQERGGVKREGWVGGWRGEGEGESESLNRQFFLTTL